jgi:hypothetical protein
MRGSERNDRHRTDDAVWSLQDSRHSAVAHVERSERAEGGLPRVSDRLEAVRVEDGWAVGGFVGRESRHGKEGREGELVARCVFSVKVRR